MYQELLTRETVEKIEFGQRHYSFQGSELALLTVEHQSAIAEEMQKVIHSVFTTHKIVGAVCTRAIIVTSDLSEVVRYWQREVGDIENGVSSPTEGVVAGKTFTWGTGHPNDTYGIIVLGASTGAGFLPGVNPELQSSSRCTLVHELAHVHDYLLRRHRLGEEVIEDSWTGFCAGLAGATWGEFFAEKATYPFQWPGDDLRTTHAIKTLVRAQEGMRDAIVLAQANGDRTQVWWTALRHLDTIFNELGRVLGLLAVAEEATPGELQRFYAQIEARVGETWKNVCERLVMTLKAIDEEPWGDTPFVGISSIVVDALPAMRIKLKAVPQAGEMPNFDILAPSTPA